MEHGDFVASPSSTFGQLHTWVDYDSKWKSAGWRVLRLNTGIGDGHSMTEFVPNWILADWRVVELDVWSPVLDGLEECWTFDSGTNIYTRDLRRTELPKDVPDVPWKTDLPPSAIEAEEARTEGSECPWCGKHCGGACAAEIESRPPIQVISPKGALAASIRTPSKDRKGRS